MRPSTRMMMMANTPGRKEPSGYMPDYWPMEPGRTEPPEMRRRRRKNGRFMEGDDPPYMSMPRIGFRGPKDWPYGDDDDDDDPQMHYGKENYSRETGGRRMTATGSVWMEPAEHDGGSYREVDEPMAMAWVKRMRPVDGSQSPKFKPDQAEQLRAAHCPQCKKWEFFVALNMMHSDYCDVAKKMGVDRADFYACMAKAFLEDPDAGENKLAKYMERVAE